MASRARMYYWSLHPESAGSAKSLRLLNVEPGDRVAAVVIPPEEPNGNGTLIPSCGAGAPPASLLSMHSRWFAS